MEQTLKAPANFYQVAATKSAFKIVITYETQSALAQANGTIKQVRTLCGNQADISCKFWNLALFQNEELRKCAVLEAAEAQMIIVALSPDGGLPDNVKHWVESWPVRGRAGQAALVTLAGPGEESAEQSRAVAWLRHAADICGLEFVCDRNDREELGFSHAALLRLAAGAFALECHLRAIGTRFNPAMKRRACLENNMPLDRCAPSRRRSLAGLFSRNALREKHQLKMKHEN